MRNKSGRVIFDRRYNTASLLGAYYGPGTDFAGRITWNPEDPNVLRLSLPTSHMIVRTRVTKRSEEETAADRIDTSEYLEQIFDTSSTGRQTRAMQVLVVCMLC